MKTIKGKPLLLALCLAAALLLSACGSKPAPAQSASSQDSSQSASGADSSDGSGSSGSEADGEDSEQTLHGTVNLVDQELELLVLAVDDTYYKFDAAGADLSGLAPGDNVTVTYTGTLDPGGDLVTAVLVSAAVENNQSA